MSQCSTYTQKPVQAEPGVMFTYGDDPAQKMAVFITKPDAKRAFLVIGGQTNGFFSCLFMNELISELGGTGHAASEPWAIVQVQLASACAGYYHGRNHIGDSEDLENLLNILHDQFQYNEFALYCWSTGVQVGLEYLKNARNTELVTRIVLGGVVLNPSCPLFVPETVQKRQRAVQNLVSDGHQEAFVPEDLYDEPFSAARMSSGGYPTLQEALWAPALAGDTDTLKEVLSVVKVPLMLMLAFSTNYQPPATLRRDFVRTVREAAAVEIVIEMFNDVCDERRRMLKGTEELHAVSISMFLQGGDERRAKVEEEQRAEQAYRERQSRSILARTNFSSKTSSSSGSSPHPQIMY